MKRTVLKLGGSVLGGPADAHTIQRFLSSYPDPLVIVVSALRGVTESLLAAEASGGPAEGLVADLLSRHLAFVESFAPPPASLDRARLRLEGLCAELGTLFEAGEGLKVPADRKVRIASFGERLSAPCLEAALASLGRRAPVLEPGELGLVARGPLEDAELDFELSSPSVATALAGLSSLVLPGFFAPGEDGLLRLFGRGGSDYSAACVAALSGAAACVFVKDSGSLLTADPRIVPSARPVAELSYAEAAALARGGAKIIHSRAVDPLEAADIPLIIVGCDGASARTLVRGPRRPDPPRAIALGRGPGGQADITIAGEGASADSAALVLAAIEAAGLGPWTIQGGEGKASYHVLVEAERGDDALRVAHAALFEGAQLDCRASLL